MNSEKVTEYRNIKILPVTYPSITSWTWHANLFAIIQELPEAQDWIYSNYIQVQCQPDFKEEHLFFEFIPFFKSILDCPVLHNQYIDRKMIRDKWIDMKDFLVYCIDNDYYIYGICNERYMLNLHQDFYHELFIYGYDFKEQTFCCADFTFTGINKYSFSRKPFEQVCQGFVDVTDETDYLLGWEGGFVLSRVYKPKDKYEIDVNYIKRNIREYLDGFNSNIHFGLVYNKKTLSHHRANGTPLAFHEFGIKVYDVLITYLCEIKDPAKIDIRPFHNMYEHKKLMTKRIEYLEKKKIINNDVNNDVYLQIEEKSLVLCNMIIKYKLKSSCKALEQILSKLREIRLIEEKELTHLLNCFV